MTRITAFLMHLGISLVIFVVLGYLIVFHWYPDFFLYTDGGMQGIRIIALVDLVLGPMLTLIVFKAGKPGLKFDLSAIATFQALCLVAGTYMVYSERPLALVYSDGFFHSMTADDYREARQPIPDFRNFDDRSPPWITVKLPEDFNQQSLIRNQARTNEAPLSTLAEYYRPFVKSDVDPVRDAYQLDEIKKREPEALGRFLSEYGGELDEYVFLPFGTRYRWALIGLRLADGEVGLLELSPIDDTATG